MAGVGRSGVHRHRRHRRSVVADTGRSDVVLLAGLGRPQTVLADAGRPGIRRRWVVDLADSGGSDVVLLADLHRFRAHQTRIGRSGAVVADAGRADIDRSPAGRHRLHLDGTHSYRALVDGGPSGRPVGGRVVGKRSAELADQRRPGNAVLARAGSRPDFVLAVHLTAGHRRPAELADQRRSGLVILAGAGHGVDAVLADARRAGAVLATAAGRRSVELAGGARGHLETTGSGLGRARLGRRVGLHPVQQQLGDAG